MTDDEIRIAIAEACGLTEYDDCPRYGFDSKGKACHIPDYLNDLNAMAKAVETLGIDGEDYAHSLWMLVAANRPYNARKAMLVLAEATARQRAEAFLRTIGKWREK